MELAIISEMPVPLPECMRMKMMRPMPDRNISTRNMITNGVNLLPLPIRFQAYKSTSISKRLMLGKEAASRHLGRNGQADGGKQRGRDVGEPALVP